jgi:hypothetical protein
MQQTFSTGPEPRIRLDRVGGDLEVHGWDKREISLDWDGAQGGGQQEGNVLMLANCTGDLTLHVPYDADVRLEGSLGGDAEARDIRRIELKQVGGDVELTNIGIDAPPEQSGEAILIQEMHGELNIRRASSVRTRGKINGDATLEEVVLVEIETVEGDLELRESQQVLIGNVAGDLEVEEVGEALRCGNVGGDCQVENSEQAEVSLGNIGGDLEIDGAALLNIGNVGGDCEVRAVLDAVHVGNVGGDLHIDQVGGTLFVGMTGSDAQLRGLHNSVRLGGIGGDLELEGDFPPESKTHLQAGGDVEITLPANANLSLQGTVGGSISGTGLSFNGNGNLVRLVYGEGNAQINVSAGGDLELHGGSQPRVNSASMPWGEFGREMADMGEQMAREFMESFGKVDWAGQAQGWTEGASRKVEEHLRKVQRKAEQNARKAEQNARKAEEHARSAEAEARRDGKRPDRFFVRVNEREWQMNPERLNDLVDRAQQAALDGVAGAMEAVERAVGNLRMPRTSAPPPPPTPPPTHPSQWQSQSPNPSGPSMPPMPPMPPMQPMQPMRPMRPMGQPLPPLPPLNFASPANQAAPEPQEAGPDLEKEREAILRMIAEGRITPEEGDMLLEGLGN